MLSSLWSTDGVSGIFTLGGYEIFKKKNKKISKIVHTIRITIFLFFFFLEFFVVENKIKKKKKIDHRRNIVASRVR